MRQNSEIRDRFGLFLELKQGKKVVSNSPIRLDQKKNNPYWLIGSSAVRHVSAIEGMDLIVEQSRREPKYGIKLRCPGLCEEPLIRFDSDGPAHRNNLPGIPLENQMVITPHINTFREDGHEFAYRPDALEDTANAAAVAKDINFGLDLFCAETNSTLENGHIPTVEESVPSLPLDDVRINLDDVNFD